MRGKTLKIVIISVGVMLLLTLITIGVVLFLARPLGTEKMESIASQFKPDPSWELVSENIVPPSTLCVSGKCHYVHKVWRTDGQPSKEDYIKALQNTGWEYELPEGCSTGENMGDGTPRCRVDIEVEEYKVSVWTTYNVNNDNIGSVVIKVQGEI